MKLPEDTLISSDKLTQYLLAFKKRNDKLQWLSQAGYALDNWQTLEKDLREQILTIDATPAEKTKYGQLFEISGELLGPNGKSLEEIMRFKLFGEVVLKKDIPEKSLKKGDVATIVEYHPVSVGEDGYSLEVFNALGDTIAVITVEESAIESLTANEVFSVRELALT